MKIKVKISGSECGSRKTITRTIEVPDFEDRIVGFLDESKLKGNTKSLLGMQWEQTVVEQQQDWIDDNYESVIIPLAEAAFLHPIEGYRIVTPKVETKRKIEDVIEAVAPYMVDKDEEFKALFIGSLYEHWESVKGLATNKIVKIVFESMGIAAQVGSAYLRELREASERRDAEMIAARATDEGQNHWNGFSF